MKGCACAEDKGDHEEMLAQGPRADSSVGFRRASQNVLEGRSDCILDNDVVPAVVRDGVVEQLRRPWIQFLVVFIGDISSHLLEHLAGLGAQIRAGDLDLFAHVFRGDSLGEFVGGLVVKF